MMLTKHALLFLALFLALAGFCALPMSVRADTYTVTSADDNGDDSNPVPGSLREALMFAEAHPGADTIAFAIPGPGLHTIRLLNSLRTIVEAVTIDGQTQSGQANSFLIELNGENAGTGANGFQILGSNVTIHGMVINGFDYDGIEILEYGNCTLDGNIIGTDAGITVAKPNHGYGIHIDASDNNTITSNVIAGNGGNYHSGGILLEAGSKNNLIAGNAIGTNLQIALPNMRSGIGVEQSGQNTFRNNIIAGNADNGIYFYDRADNNIVIQNTIGAVPSGATLTPMGNGGDGVNIVSASNNQIGGTIQMDGQTVSGGNTIVKSGRRGVSIIGTYVGTAQGNIVSDNIIGGVYIAPPPGSNPYSNLNNSLGNTLDGIYMQGDVSGTIIGQHQFSPNFSVGGNTINNNGNDGLQIEGDNAVISGNSIQGNGGRGIEITGGDSNIISHNTITNNIKGITVLAGVGQTLTQNLIYNNANFIAIDLNDDNVSGNDTGDGDTGPNNFQNYPRLTTVQTANGMTAITGTLNSAPNAPYTLEFFSAPALNESGHSDAATFLGTTNITTDGNGNATFTLAVPAVSPASAFVSATATGPDGSTSELSDAVVNNSAVSVLAAVDVTGQVQIRLGSFHYNRVTRRYTQIVTITNTSASAIDGPISLLLLKFSNAASDLRNRSGMAYITDPTGYPYINFPAASLAPGAKTSVLLDFFYRRNYPITYTPRILSGPNARHAVRIKGVHANPAPTAATRNVTETRNVARANSAVKTRSAVKAKSVSRSRRSITPAPRRKQARNTASPPQGKVFSKGG